ncbi:hypothetical protein E4U55_007875 [Claviceps digitariae]|nr:hypothetical protein E4U55_007875 [Claviceps digitariae]
MSDNRSQAQMEEGLDIARSAVFFMMKMLDEQNLRLASNAMCDALYLAKGLLIRTDIPSTPELARSAHTLLQHYNGLDLRCAQSALRAKGSANLDKLQRRQAPRGVEAAAIMLDQMCRLAHELHEGNETDMYRDWLRNEDMTSWEDYGMRDVILAWRLLPDDNNYRDHAVEMVEEFLDSATDSLDGICAMCDGQADVPPELENHTSRMECGHVFHTQCFMPWKYLLEKNCPICDPSTLELGTAED